MFHTRFASTVIRYVIGWLIADRSSFFAQFFVHASSYVCSITGHRLLPRQTPPPPIRCPRPTGFLNTVSRANAWSAVCLMSHVVGHSRCCCWHRLPPARQAATLSVFSPLLPVDVFSLRRHFHAASTYAPLLPVSSLAQLFSFSRPPCRCPPPCLSRQPLLCRFIAAAAILVFHAFSSLMPPTLPP